MRFPQLTRAVEHRSKFYRCDSVHRDQVSPRPSTKMNSRLATAAVAIHGVLRSTGATWVSLSVPLRIMLGRLSSPAFAPKVEGNAEAMT